MCWVVVGGAPRTQEVGVRKVVRRVGPRRVGGPKISRFFFTLPPQNSFFSSLSGGPFVEFWWCLKRRGAQMHVWSSRVVVWNPRQHNRTHNTHNHTPDRAAGARTRQPESPNVHRRFKQDQNSTRRPPERSKRTKMRGKTKARNFGWSGGGPTEGRSKGSAVPGRAVPGRAVPAVPNTTKPKPWNQHPHVKPHTMKPRNQHPRTHTQTHKHTTHNTQHHKSKSVWPKSVWPKLVWATTLRGRTLRGRTLRGPTFSEFGAAPSDLPNSGPSTPYPVAPFPTFGPMFFFVPFVIFYFVPNAFFYFVSRVFCLFCAVSVFFVPVRFFCPGAARGKLKCRQSVIQMKICLDIRRFKSNAKRFLTCC